MKYKLIITFLFLSASYVQGQQERLVHFGVSFTPRITNSIVYKTEVKEVMQAFSYAINGDVYLPVSPRLTLRSGLEYAVLNMRFMGPDLVFLCNILGGEDSYIRNDYSVSYLGIPLALKIKLLGSENHLYGVAGLSSMFKTTEKTEWQLFECNKSPTTIESTQEAVPKDFLMELDAGVGAEFSLNEKLKSFVELQVMYSGNSIFPDAGLASDPENDARLIEYGLTLGVKF